jgi:citrate synthase
MNSGEVGPLGWASTISETTPDGIRIRGYDLLDLVGSVPFPSALHLMFTGELPTPVAARLLDALMVASIDHGPGTPSVLAARTVISGGASFQAGAAAGLLAMGRFHAAAVEDSMRAILEVAAREDAGIDRHHAAADVVATRRRERRRLSGFGHRQHTERDPRVDRLFSMARDLGVGGSYLDAAVAIEVSLEASTGRRLPINIDGVYAAVLAEIGFPVELANAVFIASRLVGVMVHVSEELTDMPPMRRIDPVAHSYGGPAPRQLPSGGPQ